MELADSFKHFRGSFAEHVGGCRDDAMLFVNISSLHEMRRHQIEHVAVPGQLLVDPPELLDLARDDAETVFVARAEHLGLRIGASANRAKTGRADTAGLQLPIALGGCGSGLEAAQLHGEAQELFTPATR